MIRRIGLLGGTFDPPHFGHLLLAETARVDLELDQVLFLPVGQPPHKTRPISAAAHRIAMLQLAIVDNLNFTIDQTDLTRPAPHTTHTLLPLLRKAYPNAQFWLLVGTDSVRDLPEWVEPETIIRDCRLAMLDRPGVTIDWPALEKTVPGVRAATDRLEGPSMAISSTLIRGWAANGRSVRYLLPPTVIAYIERTALYRS